MKHLLQTLLSSVARLPTNRQVKSTPLVSLQFSDMARWTPRSTQALIREGYQRNPVVYRCVRLIAESAASIPITVRRDGLINKADPALQFLTQGVQGGSTADLMERFYGYLQICGNAFLEAGLVEGEPKAIMAINPANVTTLRSDNGAAMAYELQMGSVRRTLHRDLSTGCCAVFHMALFNPADQNSGFAPLAAAAQAVDIHNQGSLWTKALLDNSARPSGALVVNHGQGADQLSTDQFQRLKDELETAYSGARHAGRPMVLEGGLDWKPMSFSPADMDFMAARREAAREIALAFGVPPMLLGIPGDNTYANYKEANQAFWRQSIIPLVNKTLRGMTQWLQPFYGDDLQIQPDLDRVPALSEERIQLWARLSTADFLTQDEKRALAGLETGHVQRA